MYFKLPNSANILKMARIATGVVSPWLNSNLNYYVYNKRFPNLSNPSTFSEKLLKLKLNNYNRNSLVNQCSDKIRVRDYVHECGFSYLLNDLIEVFDNPNDFDISRMPEAFALKLNIGAGNNLICKNRKALNEVKVKKCLLSWKRSRPWIEYSERQYRSRPRFLVEKYLELNGGPVGLEDYKIYCFNGEPLAILCIAGRNELGHPRWGYFMDTSWRFISDSGKYEPINEGNLAPRPKELDVALDAAKVLSKPFPFVRVDFYFPDLSGLPVFGEMTFTPAGGIYAAEADISGCSMGELLHI